MRLKMINYYNLDKHYTSPKRISPFYVGIKRIPRKLKKRVKSFCGVSWKLLSNEQRLWYYLGKSNNNYKRFLIKTIVKNK